MIHLDKFFAAWKVSAITQAAIRAFVETRKKDGAEGANDQPERRTPAIHVPDRAQVRPNCNHPGIPGATESQSSAPGYCTPEQFLLIGRICQKSYGRC